MEAYKSLVVVVKPSFGAMDKNRVKQLTFSTYDKSMIPDIFYLYLTPDTS